LRRYPCGVEVGAHTVYCGWCKLSFPNLAGSSATGFLAVVVDA
jgi:hypothetical protein